MPRTKPVFEKVEPKVPKGTKKSVKPPKAKKNKTKTKAELAAEKKAIAEWDIYFHKNGGWVAVGMPDPSTESQEPRKLRWCIDYPDESEEQGEEASPPCEGGSPASAKVTDAAPDTLKAKDTNASTGATDATTDESSRTESPNVSLGGEGKENAVPPHKHSTNPNFKRKRGYSQDSRTDRLKTARNEATIPEENRAITHLTCTHDAPLECGGSDSNASHAPLDEPAEETGDTSFDAEDTHVRSLIPRGLVRVITEKEFQGYGLRYARKVELEKSEFAIVPYGTESIVNCAVCKSEEEEEEENEQLTVILDPHYPFHPRAWNEHIRSQEHLDAVDSHRQEELRKLSKNLRIIDGSRVRCIVCSGEWRKVSRSSKAGSYEGIIILDPDYPFHPRAWEEHVGTWSHIDNEVAMNRAAVGL